MDRAHGQRLRRDGALMSEALRQRGGVAACTLRASHAGVARCTVLDGDVETRRAAWFGTGVDGARVVVLAVARVLAERPRRGADLLHALARRVGRRARSGVADPDARAARAPVGRVLREACAVGPTRRDRAALGLEVEGQRTGTREGRRRVLIALRPIAAATIRPAIGRRWRATVFMDHRDTRPAPGGAPKGNRAQHRQHKRSHGSLYSRRPSAGSPLPCAP